jgi:hypothetical protein
LNLKKIPINFEVEQLSKNSTKLEIEKNQTKFEFKNEIEQKNRKEI